MSEPTRLSVPFDAMSYERPTRQTQASRQRAEREVFARRSDIGISFADTVAPGANRLQLAEASVLSMPPKHFSEQR